MQRRTELLQKSLAKLAAAVASMEQFLFAFFASQTCECLAAHSACAKKLQQLLPEHSHWNPARLRRAVGLPVLHLLPWHPMLLQLLNEDLHLSLAKRVEALARLSPELLFQICLEIKPFHSYHLSKPPTAAVRFFRDHLSQFLPKLWQLPRDVLNFGLSKPSRLHPMVSLPFHQPVKRLNDWAKTHLLLQGK